MPTKKKTKSFYHPPSLLIKQLGSVLLGDVWPCPFVKINAGNIRNTSFRQIYEKAPVFQNLRRREDRLKGICSECNYKTVCGGGRGRALAYSGNYLAEDPRCFINGTQTSKAKLIEV